MGYEIPQEIQHKEIIMFGLNWKQLIIGAFTLIPSFFIIVRNFYNYYNYAIAAPFIILGIGFMFLDFDKKIKAYWNFKKFQKASSTDDIMKKYLNIKEIEGNKLILKTGEELAIIQVQPTNILMKSDLEKESLGFGFQKFLNGIEFSVQFLITTNLQEGAYNRNFYIVIPKRKNLELQAKQVIGKIHEVGLLARRLTNSGIIRVFNEFFKNNNTTVTFEELKKDYTHYLLSPNSVENFKEYIKQDDTYCRVVSAAGYPRSVDFGFLNKIIKLQKDIDISIHVEPFSIEKLTIRLTRELQKQRADLYSISQKGSSNPALEIKHADTRKVLEDLQKGEEKLFLVSLYINCESSKLEELEEITQTVIAELNSLLIIPEVPKYLQAQAFKSCLPYCQNLLEYKRNITTKPLSAFFPFTSKFYTIEENGLLFGNNENNLPVVKDIFRLPNHNGVILASSGGGKSYLAKLLVQRLHKKGVKVFIIDPEGEYKSIVKNLDGQVIDIGVGGTTSINPLDLMGHSYETKRLALQEIFYLMFNNLGDLQRSALDDAVSKVFDKHFKDPEENPFPRLQDVYNVLKEKEVSATNPPDKSMYAAINYRLSVFVNGAFSFLNKNTNIDLEKNLVCFHLKDLPSAIQPVLMYLIMDFIYNRMKKLESQKVLFVDEAWSLISKTDENSFLFKIIKTCRKYEMGVFLISQEVEDLLSNKVGRALLSNSSTTILLRQKPNVIKQLNDVFHLNKEETSILLNARVGSSIMFFEDFREQVKITSTNDEHTLITSKPLKEEKNDENKIYEYLLSEAYYKVLKLKKDEIDYLLNKGYVEYDVVPIGEPRQSRVILKKNHRESPQHSFLVHNLVNCLKKYANNIKTSETSNPDITFEINGIKYGIEVETGISYYKDKDRIMNKVKELKEKFSDNFFFVLTDSRYSKNYNKYGKTFNRQTIVKQLESISREAKHARANYGKGLGLETQENLNKLTNLKK